MCYQMPFSPCGGSFLTWIGIALFIISVLIRFRDLLPPIKFFTARHEFWLQEVAKNQQFSFNLFDRRIVGLSPSPVNKKLFFHNRSLSMRDGYDLFFESTGQRTAAEKFCFAQRFDKRMSTFMNRERLNGLVPTLCANTNAFLDKFGSDGITDPFEPKSFYGLVYQLIMLTVGPEDIAMDSILLASTLLTVESMEAMNCDLTVLLPWLPSVSKLIRYFRCAKFYLLIKDIVSKRTKNEKLGEDALALMINAGDSLEEIVEITLGSLFARICGCDQYQYLLAYLGNSQPDRNRVMQELEAMVSKYDDSDEPLCLKLASVPMEGWESLTFLDQCLKESIRLNLRGLALRRAQEDLSIGEMNVRKGDFIALHFQTIHSNPEIYKDPAQFIPSRFDTGIDDKENFVGWGRGAHPCLGQRFAKLETFIVIACFLSKFDYRLCDKRGTYLDHVHAIDADTHKVYKATGSIYLKYSDLRNSV